ncbi:DegT/DnrJ/EryC1/StrS family aminotransferase [Dehalobacter sp. DCM]|uniref:DegT/DnrJ/EryC1/StrS family aminotransferase n=1 Tax=Dehalobacter sp. DCM TaxID=2907827 RepID=UPI00308132F8|nr:DegT/DnrJ/EryC1/StrS family aminotransferase [Dehalobacter sp. DCM]
MINPIYVTQPALPELQDMCTMLEKIWQSKQLSNHGQMVRQLENKLASYLGNDNLSVFANGTIALQIACKTLDLRGEVITTPFTFAATAHALAWSGIRPVFCDIEEDSFTLDPNHLEALITEETTGILPVHVFGNPCQIGKIEAIAAQYKLKTLYDAAHAFGVKASGRPIGSYGDISMFSFHATKVFHTVEGGALSFKDPALKKRADRLRNFGLNDDNLVSEPGTNGKMNEIQAAVGLLLLETVTEEIEKRKVLITLYHQLLSNIPGIRMILPQIDITPNYPYCVIRIDSREFGLTRDALYQELMTRNIFSRKYFYPLCSNFGCYRSLPSASLNHLPIANRVADSVLSLPLYGNLAESDVARICDIIRKISKQRQIK